MNKIDPDDLTLSEIWALLASSFNTDELVDALALAARDSPRAKVAWQLLRRASGDTIETLAARLALIDARNARS